MCIFSERRSKKSSSLPLKLKRDAGVGFLETPKDDELFETGSDRIFSSGSTTAKKAQRIWGGNSGSFIR